MLDRKNYVSSLFLGARPICADEMRCIFIQLLHHIVLRYSE